MIELNGITWNHTRGYLPMVATAQRFCELHPEIIIHWEKRSLQHFGDLHLHELMEQFDLLVIDHPFMGTAAQNDFLLPLDDYLDGRFLTDQAKHSVGRSNQSYQFDDHQWALAIDAAAPVSGFRRDLLEAKGLSVPSTWCELIEVARTGLVVLPGVAIDSLMHFYMMCCGLGEEPFSGSGELISLRVGIRAFEMLRELTSLVDPKCAVRNPIATWELLTTNDVSAFCPFSYGYSNYSRPGYSRYPIETGRLISIEDHERCRSTLGGAGLAVSSQCQHRDVAVGYCAFVASPACQSALYFKSGGQPGHRMAWLDDEVNRESHEFFRNTLPTLDEAWLRPRWNGYLDFQSVAADVVHHYLWNGGRANDVVCRLNDLAQDAKKDSAARKPNETTRWINRPRF